MFDTYLYPPQPARIVLNPLILHKSAQILDTVAGLMLKSAADGLHGQPDDWYSRSQGILQLAESETGGGVANRIREILDMSMPDEARPHYEEALQHAQAKRWPKVWSCIRQGMESNPVKQAADLLLDFRRGYAALDPNRRWG